MHTSTGIIQNMSVAIIIGKSAFSMCIYCKHKIPNVAITITTTTTNTSGSSPTSISISGSISSSNFKSSNTRRIVF
jgi:hypothetical protein